MTIVPFGIMYFLPCLHYWLLILYRDFHLHYCQPSYPIPYLDLFLLSLYSYWLNSLTLPSCIYILSAWMINNSYLNYLIYQFSLSYCSTYFLTKRQKCGRIIFISYKFKLSLASTGVVVCLSSYVSINGVCNIAWS